MSELAFRSSTTPKNIKINEADHAYLLQENIVAEVYGCCYIQLWLRDNGDVMEFLLDGDLFFVSPELGRGR